MRALIIRLHCSRRGVQLFHGKTAQHFLRPSKLATLLACMQAADLAAMFETVAVANQAGLRAAAAASVSWRDL
jgi:hypothetical protein